MYVVGTCVFFFFVLFKAGDGIREPLVTGVQTCALPISAIATFERQGTPAVSWHLNLAYALAALGDLGRCFATWAAAARLAERFGSMRSLRSIQLQRVAEHYWTGRWDEAEALGRA